jgi:hypothetical protein
MLARIAQGHVVVTTLPANEPLQINPDSVSFLHQDWKEGRSCHDPWNLISPMLSVPR